jgi:hypothetical protein
MAIITITDKMASGFVSDLNANFNFLDTKPLNNDSVDTIQVKNKAITKDKIADKTLTFEQISDLIVIPKSRVGLSNVVDKLQQTKITWGASAPNNNVGEENDVFFLID